MKIIEKKVMSNDKTHYLNGKVYIPDNGEIKGLFHVVHGMTEHISRYDIFMRSVANNGYVCFGYDHLGHGNTAINEDELGYFAKNDGYKYLIQDIFTFSSEIKKEYPDKKYFLMGHSMGSFIVRLYASKYNLDGLIICATGGKNPLVFTGIILSKIICKLKGDKYISSFLDKCSFGNFNNRFEKDSPYSWLTKDKNEIEKYANDKYCTFKFTASAMHDLYTLNYLSNKKTCFKTINKKLPIFMIAGDNDPVGNYGNGVKQVYNNFKKSGIKDVSLKLYTDGRHEILNDKYRNEIIDDVISFLNRLS